MNKTTRRRRNSSTAWKAYASKLPGAHRPVTVSVLFLNPPHSQNLAYFVCCCSESVNYLVAQLICSTIGYEPCAAIWLGGVDANSVQFECDKQRGRRQTAACDKSVLDTRHSLAARQLVGDCFFHCGNESNFSLSAKCSCEVGAVKLQWTEVADRRKTRGCGPDKIPMERKQIRHR